MNYTTIEESSSESAIGMREGLLDLLPKVNPADQRGTCQICLDSLPGQDVVLLPCFHAFHKQCTDRWLSRVPLCPVCRTDVTAAMQQKSTPEETEAIPDILCVSGRVITSSFAAGGLDPMFQPAYQPAYYLRDGFTYVSYGAPAPCCYTDCYTQDNRYTGSMPCVRSSNRRSILSQTASRAAASGCSEGCGLLHYFVYAALFGFASCIVSC